MRHRLAGRHLNRTAAHRRALRRNLAASLLEHGAVRTTPAKAKEVRPFVERLISTARKGTLHARRRVIAMLRDRAMVDKENPEDLADMTVVQKLFDEIAPRYVGRAGGYTRIIRLAERRIGDAGRQVLLQLVEETSAAGAETPATGSRRRKRAAQRAEAARSVEEHAEATKPDTAEPTETVEETEPSDQPLEEQAEGADEEAEK